MNRAIGCLAGVLALALWPGAAVAQTGAWETTMAAGRGAHQGGHYAEAEEKFSAALKEAEAFGPEDPRLAASLNNLASLYAARGQAAGAEPLLRRPLGIREKTLGPEHPEVAQSLNALVELHRARGQAGAAEPLASGALAIAEKGRGPGPPGRGEIRRGRVALSPGVRNPGKGAGAGAPPRGNES